MIRHAWRTLALSLIAGAATLAGCVETEDQLSEHEAALETTAREPSVSAEPDAVSVLEEIDESCGERVTFALTEGDSESQLSRSAPETAAACPVDLYFHPNNGAHGGWIESWRLCYQGGNQYKICTGGYAPVRFWNMSSCGGTVHDFYPQGWHGWAQTGGGCC